MNKKEDIKSKKDETFLEDYVSCDLEKRKGHLELIVDDLLNMKLTNEDFSAKNLPVKAAEIKEKVDKIVAFKEIYQDKINKPFFDELPQFEKDMINNLVFVRYKDIETVSNKFFLGMHVDYKKGVIDPNEKGTSEDDIREASNTMGSWQESCDAGMKVAAEKEIYRLFKYHSYYNPSLYDMMAQYKIKHYKNLIIYHKEEYSKNKEYIDVLYQKIFYSMGIEGEMDAEINFLVHDFTHYTDDSSTDKEPVYQSIKSEYLELACDEMKENLYQAKDLLEKERRKQIEILMHLLRNDELSEDTQEYKKGLDIEIDNKKLSS